MKQPPTPTPSTRSSPREVRIRLRLWAATWNILYSSIGIGVVKGMGPSREEFSVQQRPPPCAPQVAAAQNSAASGSDLSAFLARGNVLGLCAAWDHREAAGPRSLREALPLCRAPDNFLGLRERSRKKTPTFLFSLKVCPSAPQAWSGGHLGMSEVSIPSLPSLGDDARPDS